MFRRIAAWLDDRLGVTTVLEHTVFHIIPADTNWWYVFGSATLACFMLQVVTGILLAMTYAPTPESAYDSLLFITDRATLGSILRGLHNFGATGMVCMVAVHAAQVFLYAAYKFPREMTWLAGVVLLFCTLGMAFTGQILRWDQNGYWTVTLFAEMAGRVPVAGPPLVQLVLGGPTVGADTLTRLFAVHVFILPGIIFTFVGLHLYSILRHGISELPRPGVIVDPATYRRRYKELLEKTGVPFWPDAAWKDVVFTVAVIGVILALAVILGPPALGPAPDPSLQGANPRPDWYFLWLFALLALSLPGIETYLILGTVLVPLVVLIAIPLLAPYGERAPSRRPWAIVAVALTFLTIAGLIHLGDVAPWSPEIHVGPLPPRVTAGLSGQALAGAQVFEEKDCHACHRIDGSGGLRGPDLSTIGDQMTRDQFVSRIINGGTNMPAFGGNITPDQLNAVVEFLATRRAQP
ncbi:MAG TPA: cytochrome b N-terminal domain-containing protein [Chloroflexota bacterium]|jgi:ubiquinol-cytochrome c reductase cytochrome b subunit